MAVYHKEVIRTVTFRQYDEKEDAFLVNVNLRATLCNAMRDLPIRYGYRSQITPDRFSESFGTPIGRYLSITVDSENKLRQPLQIAQEGLVSTCDVEMPPLGIRSLEVEYEIWWKANELQRLSSRIYTDYYELHFLNRLEFTLIINESKKEEGPERMSLLYNEKVIAKKGLAIRPGEVVYAFSVASPASTI